MLAGIKVLELEGLAPVPHCGLLLADLGAQVTVIAKVRYFSRQRIDPSKFQDDNQYPEQRLIRGKARESIDLKTKEGVLKVDTTFGIPTICQFQLREMCRTNDVLLDPYRPGILEKMGLDPISLLSEVPFTGKLTQVNKNGTILGEQRFGDLSFDGIWADG